MSEGECLTLTVPDRSPSNFTDAVNMRARRKDEVRAADEGR